MKVFLSWLVANFEVFVTVLLCIVFGILFAVGIDSFVFTAQEKWGLIGVAVFFMALPASITVKNFEMSMILFLLMLAGYISDVDMFDMTLKYSLNRFMAAFVYISWAGLWTVGYSFLKSL